VGQRRPAPPHGRAGGLTAASRGAGAAWSVGRPGRVGHAPPELQRGAAATDARTGVAGAARDRRARGGARRRRAAGAGSARIVAAGPRPQRRAHRGRRPAGDRRGAQRGPHLGAARHPARAGRRGRGLDHRPARPGVGAARPAAPRRARAGRHHRRARPCRAGRGAGRGRGASDPCRADRRRERPRRGRAAGRAGPGPPTRPRRLPRSRRAGAGARRRADLRVARSLGPGPAAPLRRRRRARPPPRPCVRSEHRSRPSGLVGPAAGHGPAWPRRDPWRTGAGRDLGRARVARRGDGTDRGRPCPGRAPAGRLRHVAARLSRPDVGTRPGPNKGGAGGRRLVAPHRRGRRARRRHLAAPGRWDDPDRRTVSAARSRAPGGLAVEAADVGRFLGTSAELVVDESGGSAAAP